VGAERDCPFYRHKEIPGTPAIDDRSDSGWTALFFAVATGQTEAVHALLSAGAAVNIHDRDDNTALHLAARCRSHSKNYPLIVQMLLNAGAALDPTCDEGWTPLHEACYFPKFGFANKLKNVVAYQLLRAGANPKLPSFSGESTPMHLLCENTYYGDFTGELLLTMCALGANPNAADVNGQRPLHLLVEQVDTLKLVEILHQNFKALDFSPVNNFGQTPLHRTPPHPNNAVEYLLWNGAKMDAQDSYGDTPLHVIARCCGDMYENSDDIEINEHVAGVNCLEMLLRHGAALGLQNKHGSTATDEAFRSGNHAVLALLRAACECQEHRRTAFAMGYHDRLGSDTRIQVLDPGIIKMILGGV
jgi:ankyrin repeat protein